MEQKLQDLINDLALLSEQGSPDIEEELIILEDQLEQVAPVLMEAAALNDTIGIMLQQATAMLADLKRQHRLLAPDDDPRWFLLSDDLEDDDLLDDEDC